MIYFLPLDDHCFRLYDKKQYVEQQEKLIQRLPFVQQIDIYQEAGKW